MTNNVVAAEVKKNFKLKSFLCINVFNILYKKKYLKKKIDL